MSHLHISLCCDALQLRPIYSASNSLHTLLREGVCVWVCVCVCRGCRDCMLLFSTLQTTADHEMLHRNGADGEGLVTSIATLVKCCKPSCSILWYKDISNGLAKMTMSCKQTSHHSTLFCFTFFHIMLKCSLFGAWSYVCRTIQRYNIRVDESR